MLGFRTLASFPLAAQKATHNEIFVGASEAKDIIRLKLGHGFFVELAATEAKDTLSASLTRGRTLRLYVSEASDRASFVVDNKSEVSISSTEARDIASVYLDRGVSFSFWVSEAQDTALMRFGLTSKLSFSASEARDTASFAVVRPSSLVLRASEALDTSNINLLRSPAMTISASEAQDIAAFVLNNQNIKIIASETPDRASFELVRQIRVWCNATETPDGCEIYVAPRWIEINGTPCCTRWTEATRPDSQYVALGELVINVSETPDTFSGGGASVSPGYILLDRQFHTTTYILGSTPDDYILLEDGGYLKGDG